MKKSDYYALSAAIAQAYSEAKSTGERKGIESAMEHVCHALQVENPSFSTKWFVATTSKMIKHLR